MIKIFASILSCSLALSHISLAGETSALLSSKSVMPELDEIVESDWSFDARLDAWIAQMSIGVQQKTLGFEQSIFIGFDDIISNLDWIVPIGADIRYKRFGFLPDILGMKLSGHSQTPGQLFSELEVDMEMWVINLPVYYRVIEKPGYSLDLLAGARYLSVDVDLDLTGGIVGNNLGRLSANAGGKHWDGIIGARVQHDLNDRLFYSIYGDVGAGDSDLTWQVLASLGYRFNDRLSGLLGYRYLYYESGDSVKAVDITASGPQLSLNWKF